VSVQVTFTLPQWEPPPAASKELIDQWNAYLDALQQHENGHREIGVAAGQAIYQALGRLPSYDACDALERAADAACQQILDQHRQQELDYDQATNHGATQGAHFP
jgi:predicted secreted Zn-dependent protease